MSETYDIINSDVNPSSILDTLSCGKLQVIKYETTNKPILIKFLDTGYIKETQYSHLRRGNVRDPYRPTFWDVGFVGEGIYKINSKAGVKWVNMLKRCYDETYHRNKPTYKNCEVAEEWQDFQNFALWFEETYPRDGDVYELDKDFVVLGNKTYSGDNCCWLPRKINSFFINFSENSGTSYDKRIGKWVARCSRFSLGGKGDIHLGNYSTQEEARRYYLKEKLKVLEELLEKYNLDCKISDNMRQKINHK